MKKYTLALIIVFLFCVFLRATDVRINGLGLVNYMVADDDTLMQIYPAQITNYQNELEMSTVSTIGFVDYTIGNIAAGLQYINYTGTVNAPTANSNMVFYPYAYPISGSVPNPVTIYQLAKTLNLILGLKISELSSAALTLGYAGGGDGGENSALNPAAGSYAYNITRNSYDLSLGIGYSVKNFLDIGVLAGIPSANNSGVETLITNSLSNQPYANETMKMTYGVYGKLNARMLILPFIIGISSSVASEEIDDFQQKDNNNDGNFTDYSDTNTKYTDIYRNYTFSAGASISLQLSQSITIYPAININYSYNMNERINTNYENLLYGTNTEIDTGSWNIPWYIAVEDKINEYVTWRGGFRSYLYNYSGGNSYDYIYFPNYTVNFISTQTLSPAVMSGISVYIGGVAIDSGITFGNGFTGNLAAALKF